MYNTFVLQLVLGLEKRFVFKTNSPSRRVETRAVQRRTSLSTVWTELPSWFAVLLVIVWLINWVSPKHRALLGEEKFIEKFGGEIPKRDLRAGEKTVRSGS